MTLSLGAVCDGLIYTSSTEHSPTNPLWRQSYVRAININDGTEAWKVDLFSQGFSIADGYLVSASQYDNLVYCIGKGPSEVTVSAPQTVISKGNDVLITGTVTDQSPGAKGTPAIADENMQAWMEYLYEQQPCPTTAKGVQVHVTAIDPNGNSQDIGYATSDMGGSFGIAWTPPIEGTYQVTATFDGTKSYGSSYATTHFAVGRAAAASPSPTSVPQPPGEGLPTTTYIAIAAAVIIIAVVAAAILLRRRK